MQQLSKAFAPEIDALTHTFDLVAGEETYEPAHFGNASLLLNGPSVSFRLIRDRGDIFVDVRDPVGEWMDVRGILGDLGLLTTPEQTQSPSELLMLVCDYPNVFAHLPRK